MSVLLLSIPRSLSYTIRNASNITPHPPQNFYSPTPIHKTNPKPTPTSSPPSHPAASSHKSYSQPRPNSYSTPYHYSPDNSSSSRASYPDPRPCRAFGRNCSLDRLLLLRRRRRLVCPSFWESFWQGREVPGLRCRCGCGWILRRARGWRCWCRRWLRRGIC
jgi:hypothetical protein